jgi:predicted DNA-binding transcriptional regulator AlpA
MPHKFFRKSQVATRYGVDERTVDRWKLDGRLPPPRYRGRMPLWREDELDALDRRATVTANQDRPKQTGAAT